MRPHLMHPDHDFDVSESLPGGAEDLVADLELGTLVRAMSGGDVRYRQEVLDDCRARPETVRALHSLAVEALEREHVVYRSAFASSPASVLASSVRRLTIFAGELRTLRRIAETHSFSSDGFVRFFSMVASELTDDHLADVDRLLAALGLPDGLLLSARPGEGGHGADHVLRALHGVGRGPFRRTTVARPRYSFTIPERDEAGAQALSRLRGRALDGVAEVVAGAAEHLLGFFEALRTELSFYLGALDLEEVLVRGGHSVTMPVPAAPEQRGVVTLGLYDPSLALHVDGPVTGNDVDAPDAALVMITGANRGGKSTFLRALADAQLMMRCGLFVAAESFTAPLGGRVHTHFGREEDATMTRGRLDEELARTSEIADRVRPGDLVVLNESFSSTNEREGSQIARDVVRALLDAGVRVCFVTHLFELAHGLFVDGRDDAVFLRAERAGERQRGFRLVEDEPLPTSWGEDLYRRIFETPGSIHDERGRQT